MTSLTFPPTRLNIQDVNPHLTCVLCGGYFIDATTITECLHSFCKKCILVYLETSKCCPICDTQVHKTKSLLNLRPDKTLQDIVYKIVPGLYKTEMKNRRDFYSTHKQQDPVSPEDGGDVRDHTVLAANHKVSLCLKYADNDRSETYDKCEDEDTKRHLDSNNNMYERRYLLCPAAMTVSLLHKFIKIKFELSDDNKIDLLYSSELLKEEITLADIVYTYGWDEDQPLVVSYRIHERTNKRPKIDESLPKVEDFSSCFGESSEHVSTSSGRKTKYSHSCVRNSLYGNFGCVAKRKSSPKFHASKKRRESGHEECKEDCRQTKLRKDKIVKNNGHNKNVDDKKPEVPVFDVPDVAANASGRDDDGCVLNAPKDKCCGRKCDGDCVETETEPEVPHIAIKISKIGDAKNDWSSQPCQITNLHQKYNFVQNPLVTKIRRASSESSKDYHRREMEEDSGRGSDVSSPSLLSPSCTDPSMSPPNMCIVTPPPPHETASVTSPRHFRSPADNHSSQNKRTTPPAASECSSKENDDSTTSTKNDVSSIVVVVDHKSHKKRTHKYETLTVKVPETKNEDYCNVMASIPSPENPLLLKITRQFPNKTQTSPRIPETKKQAPNLLFHHHSKMNESEKYVVPVIKNDLPCRGENISDSPSEVVIQQKNLQKPLDTSIDDGGDGGSASTNEPVPKRRNDNEIPEILKQTGLVRTNLNSVGGDDVEIRQDGVSTPSLARRDEALPKREQPQPILKTSTAAATATISSPKSRSDVAPVKNLLGKASSFEFVGSGDDGIDANSSCSRVKPYVPGLHKKCRVVGQVPSPSSSHHPRSSLTGDFNRFKSTTKPNRSKTEISAPFKNEPPPSSLSPFSNVVENNLRSSMSPRPNLEQELKAIPGLRIPRFIPRTTWYNVPPNDDRSYPMMPPLSVSTTTTTESRHRVNTDKMASLSSSDEKNADERKDVEVRHKTPQQVSRPSFLHHPHMFNSTLQHHHHHHQALLQQAMVARLRSMDPAIQLKHPGPSMPGLWRFPGYPPYSMSNHK
ncbi:BMI1 (predicted) [Pycnogonum litorale]